MPNIMKILLLFITLFLTISAFGQTAKVAEAEVYTDQQYPFSITVPKGWKKTQEPKDQMRILANSENGFGGTNFNLNVRELAEVKSVTSAEFAKKMTVEDPEYFDRITKSMIPGSKIASSGRGKLGAEEAIYVIFSGDYKIEDRSLPLKFYVFQMFSAGNLYTLTFTSGQDEFEGYYPTFKEVAASFKLRAVSGK